MGPRRSLAIARFGRRQLARMRAGRRQVLAHLRAPDAHPVPPPTFVQLKVTNLCNLRCAMCGQWGDTGIYRLDRGEARGDGDGRAERERIRELVGARRQLGLADWVRLLDEVAPFDPIVGLFGGEPFLFPEVMTLVREVKRRGLLLTAITNGWHLEEHAREIVEAGMESIAVSIDGGAALHNRIRRNDESFARLAAGLHALSRWRRELSRPLPMTIAILPITELNIGGVAEAVAELQRLPLDVINIGLRWWIPGEVGARYEREMREGFGVGGESWKGFGFTWPAARRGELNDLVRVLKRIKRRRLLDASLGRPWVTFLPDLAPDQVPAYFTDFGETFGHELCPAPWYFAQVEPDGAVCFCGDFPDVRLGNVREAPFAQIWRSESAAAFRARLAAAPLAICNRCCGTFVHGRWPRPRVGRVL